MWKRSQTIPGYWHKDNNQRVYLDWLSKELGYNELDDWYKIKYSDFKENHGGGLLDIYNRGIVNLIVKNYPEHEWFEWLFENSAVPVGYWGKRDFQKKYVKWLGIKLKYKKDEDWYNLIGEDLRDNHGGTLISSRHHYYGSSIEVVTNLFS